MKNLFSGAICTLLACALLAGCGSSASSAVSIPPVDPAEQSDHYRQVIEDARNPELNGLGLYAIATPADREPPDFDTTDFTALTEEQRQQVERHNMYQVAFTGIFGLKEEDYTAYAISMGNIITIAYGTAIVLPAAGKTQAVEEQLNAFVTAKQQEFANYLQDQYQIALGAKVETLPTGEVVMVMSQDADAELAAIRTALAA